MPFDGNAKDAAILHTCLALASASVDCAENSDVPLRAGRTKTACRLAVQLLVGIAQTAHQTAPHRTALRRVASHRIAAPRTSRSECSQTSRACPGRSLRRDAASSLTTRSLGLEWRAERRLIPRRGGFKRISSRAT